MTSDLPLHPTTHGNAAVISAAILGLGPCPVTLGAHGIPTALVWIGLSSVKHFDLAHTF